MSFLKRTAEEKEKKQQEVVQRFLDKYHLTGIDENDLTAITEISRDLTAQGLIKFGMLFNTKPEEIAKVTYLSAIVRQNFIIIRKLDEISKRLIEGK